MRIAFSAHPQPLAVQNLCYINAMVIGIAGGSGSGKSSLARLVAKKLNADVISLDNYFKNPSGFPVVYGHFDYDRLEAVDFAKCVADIKAHRGPLVVEGFLILADEKLKKLLDVSFFIDSEPSVLAARRIARDTEVNPEYITKHVQKQYKKLVQPTKRYADLILDGNRPVTELSETAWKFLRSRGFVTAKK